jgi:phosphocarrier protein HPr
MPRRELSNVPKRTVTVGSASGLHARPAKLFVEAATRLPVQVRISAGDKPSVSARSLLSVLALGVEHGTEVTLEADGPEADQALDALATLLTRDLDAEKAPTTPAALA